MQEAAYRRGVKVMAHAQGAEGIKNAVRAGIHSIEHGIYLDDEGCWNAARSWCRRCWRRWQY